MGRFKTLEDPGQGYLLPPSPRDWLPQGHLSWFISDTVDQLDLDEFLDAYRTSGKGELPYHPKLLLRILIYAYCAGVFSSRKIARQIDENIAFRVLAAGSRPDHRTICRFRERFLDKFRSLFVQVVQIAAASGLVRMGSIAVDGSKVKANASKHKAMSYDRMRKEERRLKGEIKKLTELASTTDKREDKEFGPDVRGDELPAELERRESRLRRIQEAKRELEDRKAMEAEEATAARELKRTHGGTEEGDRPRKNKSKPKNKDQQNFTDPDSRIMKTKTGFEQCYNAQVAVDDEKQIIVAASTGQSAADSRELIPVVQQAVENTDISPEELLADAGYKSEENLQTLESAQIDAYIAMGREGKKTKGNRSELEATARMRRKMTTPEGRARYRRRKHIVEPAFGWIKNVVGFVSFSVRGLQKVSGEWNLVCLATNLRRMNAMVESS